VCVVVVDGTKEVDNDNVVVDALALLEDLVFGLRCERMFCFVLVFTGEF